MAAVKAVTSSLSSPLTSRELDDFITMVLQGSGIFCIHILLHLGVAVLCVCRSQLSCLVICSGTDSQRHLSSLCVLIPTILSCHLFRYR